MLLIVHVTCKKKGRLKTEKGFHNLQLIINGMIPPTKAERTISECKNAEDKNVDGTNAEKEKRSKKRNIERKKIEQTYVENKKCRKGKMSMVLLVESKVSSVVKRLCSFKYDQNH